MYYLDLDFEFDFHWSENFVKMKRGQIFENNNKPPDLKITCNTRSIWKWKSRENKAGHLGNFRESFVFP